MSGILEEILLKKENKYMKEHPHNFIANQANAKYPTICTKCGLGIDKYTTPVVTVSGFITRKLPPCPYESEPELAHGK